MDQRDNPSMTRRKQMGRFELVERYYHLNQTDNHSTISGWQQELWVVLTSGVFNG